MPNGLSSNLRGDVPIALLPVRLETRFVTATGGQQELLIRVYVDDIHRDTHEPELTEDELQWGQNFWRETWRAGLAPAGSEFPKRQAQELAAWKQLAGRFGSARATHIARVLEPTNPNDRPAQLNLGRPLTKNPVFLQLNNLRKASWTRAAQARALPDRWLIVGYINGQTKRQWGAPIPSTLAIGPNPMYQGVTSSSQPPDPSAIDPEMQWVVDFEAAITKGMGIRMPLTPQEASGGFDRLLVLGIREAGGSAQTGSAELRSLLDAHRFTWGFSLLPQGTPTNNTEDTRSGYSREDVGFQASFTLREQAAPEIADDGWKVAAALGLDPISFSGIGSANGHEQRDAEHINRTLWPVTLGYFLEQILNDSFSEYDADMWRNYYVTTVRARGPLPALRVGRQPYAILPVTTLDGWGVNAPKLLPLLKLLREIWFQSVGNIPHAGRDTSTAGRDLVEALGQDAQSSAYSWRWTRGADFIRNFWRLPKQQIPPDALETAVSEIGDHVKAVLQQIGLNASPNTRLASLSFAAESMEFTGPLVQSEDLAKTDPLKHNYIALLANNAISLTDIHDESAALWPDEQTAKPLLYRLLRHATLLAYAEQALQESLKDPNKPFGPKMFSPPWFDPELVDAIANPTFRDSDVSFRSFYTMTFWRVLQKEIADPDNPGKQSTHGDLLRRKKIQDLNEPLRSFLLSLEALALLSVTELERLVTEAIDLASHRLDAWITSLATYQLRKIRSQQGAANGLYLGGYGWVENLRPRAGLTSSDGFIHAPSITHANAAAVLRSGYLTHKMQPEGARLQIDLSSRRVRIALSLIDGVRQGQSLGALLGYQIERKLHENHLDRVIFGLRELAPLVGGKQIPKDSGEPLDSIAANNVVDGSRLLERFQTEPDLFAIFGQDGDAIKAQVIILQDAVDAIGDLALAEGIYQGVQGNWSRAGASLDSISRGDTPGDFEVLRTPRAGIGFTQRVMVLFTQKFSDANGWSVSNPRAVAEPILNAWAGQLLGPPNRVKFSVDYFNPGNDPSKRKPDDTKMLSLADLRPLPCPLDIIYSPPISEQPQQTELELRLVRLAVEKRDVGIQVDAQLKMKFARDTFGGESQDLTLPDLFELSRAIRELIVNSRALNARDLAIAGSSDDIGIEVEQLRARYVTVRAMWNDAQKKLKDLVELDDHGQTIDLIKLQDALQVLSGFAVQHAVPAIVTGDIEASRLEVLKQARSVKEQVGSKSKQLPIAQPDALGPAELLASMAVLFGEGFRIATPFTFRLGQQADFLAALKQRETAADAGPLQTAEWIHSVSTVREGSRRLQTAQLLADTVNGGNAAPLRVAQFPIASKKWNVPDELTNTGATSIVAAMPGITDGPMQNLPDSLAGLLVDEWVEVIPRKTTDTGLAFHHDSPGACAPQAILLAVSPDLSKPWDEETLIAIIGETLDLSKLRMVDYDNLQGLGHILPAIYLANNVGGVTGGDTVSTRPPDQGEIQ